MPPILQTILYVFAFVLFVIVAFPVVDEPRRTRVLAAGLACGALAMVLGPWLGR